MIHSMQAPLKLSMSNNRLFKIDRGLPHADRHHRMRTGKERPEKCSRASPLFSPRVKPFRFETRTQRQCSTGDASRCENARDFSRPESARSYSGFSGEFTHWIELGVVENPGSAAVRQAVLKERPAIYTRTHIGDN